MSFGNRTKLAVPLEPPPLSPVLADEGLEPANLRVMTTSHAVDLWLGELERLGHTPRTISTYRGLLDKLADSYPHLDISELTPTMIRRFLDQQALRRDGARKAAATVAQNVSIVAGLFDWLTREGIIQRNPTRRNGDRVISRPRQQPPEDNDAVVTVSGRDVARLLQTAEGWQEQLAVATLAYLGPRRHALASARITDYDPAERTLTFREKGAKVITKPVPDRLADLIDAAILAGVYHEQDYLVPGYAGQRRRGDRDDRVIWRIVRRVANRAGVETHVHALRAAFAVHFLEEKPGELVALQKLMGHRRLETTLVYLRRLDRRRSMETVRDLNGYGASSRDSSAISGIHLESLRVAEKEGFEPSSGDLLGALRAGIQLSTSAPSKERA